MGATQETEAAASCDARQRRNQRLRNAEIQLAKMETKLDTELGHLATKNDLTAVKVWVLSGVLGGMAIAAGIAVAVARLL